MGAVVISLPSWSIWIYLLCIGGLMTLIALSTQIKTLFKRAALVLINISKYSVRALLGYLGACMIMASAYALSVQKVWSDPEISEHRAIAWTVFLAILSIIILTFIAVIIREEQVHQANKQK